MNPEQFGRSKRLTSRKLKRLLRHESQHQSQSNERSLVRFDHEKAVSNYLGTQSTFKPTCPPSFLKEAGELCVALKNAGAQERRAAYLYLSVSVYICLYRGWV